MRNYIGASSWMTLAVALAFLPSLCKAQTFVYTNNNNILAANTLSGYLVKANGEAVEVKDSPFQTGGEGEGTNGYIPANRITVCEKFLFASNDYSGTVSGFAINPLTGHLKPVPGSPFTVSGADSEGIPVIITSDCKRFCCDPQLPHFCISHVSANRQTNWRERVPILRADAAWNTKSQQS